MKTILNTLAAVTLVGMLAGCHSTTSKNTSGDAEVSGSATLTAEQKYALAYMWNEEKLAKELYLALDAVWDQDPLSMIALNSETKHEQWVEDLVEAYDINITDLDAYEVSYSEAELRAFGPGEFAIPEVQALYDSLFAKGARSAQEALEVGCMVEVTDVEDLNAYLAVAQGADDLVSTFELLRTGSYNHYWAFSNMLKSMGVTEGCCSLGERFCKTKAQYPGSH